MTTLREAIQANDDKLFNDGATTWDADNLLDSFAHAGSESLVQEVVVTEQGIFALDDQGHMKSVPLYRFETPQPSDIITSGHDFATPLEHDLTVLVADLWGFVGQLDPRLPAKTTEQYLAMYRYFLDRLTETGVLCWMDDRAEEIRDALDAQEEKPC